VWGRDGKKKRALRGLLGLPQLSWQRGAFVPEYRAGCIAPGPGLRGRSGGLVRGQPLKFAVAGGAVVKSVGAGRGDARP